MIANIDTELLRTNLESLVRASRDSNLLYHTLLIRPGQHAPVAHREFSEDLYQLTRQILDSHHSEAHSAAVMPPHLQVFLLQLHLEGKTFYSLMRNLITIATPGWKRKFHWDPWTKQNKEITSSGQLSTTKIIDNIIADLRPNHGSLADQFEHCFGRQVSAIRHAVAHAMFIRPSPAAAEHWRFAEFDFLDTTGFARLRETRLTVEDMDTVVSNLIGFKHVAYQCLEQERVHLKTLRYKGQHPNQMAPEEMIDLEIIPEHVSIKMPKTPFMPGMGYATTQQP